MRGLTKMTEMNGMTLATLKKRQEIEMIVACIMTIATMNKTQEMIMTTGMMTMATMNKTHEMFVVYGMTEEIIAAMK